MSGNITKQQFWNTAFKCFIEKRVWLSSLTIQHNCVYIANEMSARIYYPSLFVSRTCTHTHTCCWTTYTLMSLKYIIQKPARNQYILITVKSNYISPLPLKSSIKSIERSGPCSNQCFHMWNTANKYGVPHVKHGKQVQCSTHETQQTSTVFCTANKYKFCVFSFPALGPFSFVKDRTDLRCLNLENFLIIRYTPVNDMSCRWCPHPPRIPFLIKYTLNSMPTPPKSTCTVQWQKWKQLKLSYNQQRHKRTPHFTFGVMGWKHRYPY